MRAIHRETPPSHSSANVFLSKGQISSTELSYVAQHTLAHPLSCCFSHLLCLSLLFYSSFERSFARSGWEFYLLVLGGGHQMKNINHTGVRARWGYAEERKIFLGGGGAF